MQTSVRPTGSVSAAFAQPFPIAAFISSHTRCNRQTFGGRTSKPSELALRIAPVKHYKASARRGSSMADATTAHGDGNGKTSVLFVCLGNICRSPSAEAVFKAVVERAGLADRFFIDSCGTGGGASRWYKDGGFSYHEGDGAGVSAADSRMQAAARRRDMHLTSRSRPLDPTDFIRFDYIIGMDDTNLQAIQTAADHWSDKHEIPADYMAKVSKMTQYLRSDKFRLKYDEVPDPYFETAGKTDGFDLVLDLLEDACECLLQETGVQAV